MHRRHGTLLCWFVRRLREILINKTWLPCIAWQGWQMKRCDPLPLLRQNVLIYLGIPLLLGVAMWAVGRNYPGYRTCFLPRFAPSGLIALLWTVVMMFAEMSKPLLGGQAGNDKKLCICQSISWFKRENPTNFKLRIPINHL